MLPHSDGMPTRFVATGTQFPVTGRLELESVGARFVGALLLALLDNVVVGVLVVGCTMAGDELPHPASPTRPTMTDADKTQTGLDRIHFEDTSQAGRLERVRLTQRARMEAPTERSEATIYDLACQSLCGACGQGHSGQRRVFFHRVREC